MVSFICTTYRRARCVERIITQYINQDYDSDIELIILNTDVDNPITLIPVLQQLNIKVINNNISYSNNLPYTNRGDICADAVSHASGEYFMLADDDDYYLPWHIRQAVDGIKSFGTDAWKPDKSFFRTPRKLELAKNTMEASVIVKMERIRDIGFLTNSGYEGLGWYTTLRDTGQLKEDNTEHIPSYCFNWGDPPEMAGHKQSGDIDNPNNFENHKVASSDKAVRPLGLYDINTEYKEFYKYISQNMHLFNRTYYNEYAKRYVESNG
jgi:glycosyltransferase involved in cell wall biosynthesis